MHLSILWLGKLEVVSRRDGSALNLNTSDRSGQRERGPRFCEAIHYRVIHRHEFKRGGRHALSVAIRCSQHVFRRVSREHSMLYEFAATSIDAESPTRASQKFIVNEDEDELETMDNQR